MTAVGVIGLGAMGSSIAERFEAGGHELRTWNRTEAKGTPAGVARASEVVVIIVSDPAALAAVSEGGGRGGRGLWRRDGRDADVDGLA